MKHSNVKVPSLRSGSSTDSSTIQRIVSADGTRWATSRACKVSEGFGRFGIVIAWTLKQRVNGKAVTIGSGRSEAAARSFIANCEKVSA